MVQRLALELGCGTHVQRLYNARIDCRNDVHSSGQIRLSNTGFPRVRKASLHSRLTVTDEGNCQSYKDLLALAQIGRCMCIPVKLAEIRALTHGFSLALPLCRRATMRES
jgi:hypothetical protein